MNSIIPTFVDNGIEWLRQKDILMSPDPDMPIEMFDDTRKNSNDWKPWKAIQSTVTDNEILTLENQIGYKLPNSYKDFLKYKHFYSIHTSNNFEPFRHLINNWKETLLKNYFHSELREFMLDRGYIWFGGHEDWGFLCFDTNKKSIDNEYSIVLIDHETIDQQEQIYKDFYDCLLKNTVTIL